MKTEKKEKVITMKTRIKFARTLAVTLLTIVGLTTKTAFAQGNQLTGLTVDRLMLGSIRHVSRPDSLSVTQKLPSPSNAVTLSLAWTLVPIAAGAVIWAIQKPEHVTEYCDGQVAWDYAKYPNRTLPLVLAATGIMFGPSVGYFYGECGTRGATGIAIRGLMVAATVAAATAVGNSYHSEGFMDFSGLDAAITVGVVGCGIIVIDSMYDLCVVKKNVRSQNDRKLAARVNLAPGFAAGSNTPTLNLHVTF
jgi:hypothetical protein